MAGDLAGATIHVHPVDRTEGRFAHGAHDARGKSGTVDAAHRRVPDRPRGKGVQRESVPLQSGVRRGHRRPRVVRPPARVSRPR